MNIRVQLLGGCECQWTDGRAIEFSSRKALALLVLLAMAPHMHRTREQVAATLWSRSAEEQGRASLRQTLSELRKLLGEDNAILRASGSQIALDPARVEVDAVQLQQVAVADSIDEQSRVTDLYRGDFLAGFSLRDNEFEDWAIIERRRLRDLAVSALIRLCDHYLQAGDVERGIPIAESLVEVDALAEAGHRALMLYYAMQGRRNEALRQYAACAELLHSELGLQPSAELQNLQRCLLAGEELPGAQRLVLSQPRGHGDYPELVQEVRYCKSFDGVNIAFAELGNSKPVLVMTGNWLTHLQESAQSPVWRPLIDELTQKYRLLRYDQRGMGLSDWDVDDTSLDSYVADLEAVVDAADLPHFRLFGICQGAAIATVYAARHPERVERMVLLSGLERGWRNRSATLDRVADTFAHMTRKGWGKATPAYRQLFSTLLIPDATQEHLHSLNELQRCSSSPENAVRVQEFMGSVDISAYTGQVRTPTLVMHPQSDPFIPIKQGKKLAADIPNARFLPLPSSNHLILNHEPAWPIMLKALHGFLAA
ncbi:alpha/beta fold hydrolase [Pseudomaricurvus alcaniphilus]|uniref:alpha/beta hydrolase n=1 Tax=Pseudomaricurvus alcaniphilus TaxID=1166482 RepID=UPI00140A5EA3|nr:alpha/beta hydrolase [Pseudomaricurvus alcaniphilus]NHN37234.1 alpha/beta fold hydrolase [Pseudomaricurvus alcaniphilus]